MEKVLITGVGLIGTALAYALKNQGYEVQFLSRSQTNSIPFKIYKWNVEAQELDVEALKGVHHIIHLAGANIAEKRWTDLRKKQIIDSRVLSTRLLYNSVKREKTPLKSMVCASAIGYYGALTSEKIFTETDPAHTDFLGQVCQLWEDELNRFSRLKIRTVILRTGVVFSKNGGAFIKLKQPIASNIGAALGNGNQYIPWIHNQDLINMYLRVLKEDRFEGTFNAVAPEHHTNKEITKAIAQRMGKTLWLPPIPSFVMRLVFGELSSILLYGSRVSPKKIQDMGFSFNYSNLNAAIDELLSN